MLLFTTALLLVLARANAQTTGPQNYRIVCYVEGWTHWRQEPVKFETEDIDTSLCTHVAWNYAELDPSGTHIIPHDNFDYGIWQKLTALKQQQPGLKVLLTIGGWGMGSDEFSTMTSSPDTIQQFVTGAIKLLHSYRFDGLVIDWEFPTTRDDPPEDKHRFTQLLQATYEAFANDASETGRPRLLLVATISPNPWQVSHSYELPDISNYVDWLDVKAFGLHGTWEQTSGHHSSLYTPSEDDTDSIHYMVQKIISASVPANKMTLGIAFYGISENMTDSTDLGSPIAGGGEGGPVLHQQGMMAYFEICKILNEQEGITSGRLPGTNAPFISSGNTWTGYDDPTSVQEKAEYVKQQGLSGVSLWTIDLDDFNGMCGDKNPLLHAVSNQFNPVVG